MVPPPFNEELLHCGSVKMLFSGYERIGSKGKSESPGAFASDPFGNPFSKLSPHRHL
jgi:hypothetical protein